MRSGRASQCLRRGVSQGLPAKWNEKTLPRPGRNSLETQQRELRLSAGKNLFRRNFRVAKMDFESCATEAYCSIFVGYPILVVKPNARKNKTGIFTSTCTFHPRTRLFLRIILHSPDSRGLQLFFPNKECAFNSALRVIGNFIIARIPLQILWATSITHQTSFTIQ